MRRSSAKLVPVGVAEASAAYSVSPRTCASDSTEMPLLDAGALWPVQQRAIVNLEESLALAKAAAR